VSDEQEGGVKSPAVIQKAHDMVSALCDCRRDWVMSVPARSDYDPDLVIGAALSVADELHSVVERWEAMWSRYTFPAGGAWPMVKEEHEAILSDARAVLEKARGEK